MNSHHERRTLPRQLAFGAATLACFALLLGATPVVAEGDDDSTFDFSRGRGRDSGYMITITNLTYDQIISPPVVVVHNEQFRLFQPGLAAGSELTALAEDGMTGPLAGLLAVSPGVSDYAVAGGGILPGGSATVEVRVQGNARMISVAGMLVSTNDAFVGLDGYALPFGLFNSSRTTTINAQAYDAGSEANTESCAHIPGPPCGNPGVRVTDGAEGFVHVHRGIQGVGELDAPTKDWRNPAARISIQRK
jgi:hypothetical protein